MAPSIQLQKAMAAVKAMKLIGFDQGVAKKELKNLLNVYENNWEHIEAENYRLLADAILDNQESMDSEANEKDEPVTTAPERPLKRLRHVEEASQSQWTDNSEAHSEDLSKRKKIVTPDEGPSQNFRDEHCSYDRRGHAIPETNEHTTSIYEAQPEKGQLGSLSRHHGGEHGLHSTTRNEFYCKETAPADALAIPDKPMDRNCNETSRNHAVTIAVQVPHQNSPGMTGVALTSLQRAVAAVKAMKLIGFDHKVAKTVLKKLLKTYGNNWEYVEAENYKLLADAILDDQDSKDAETNEKYAAVANEPEIFLKRPRCMEDPGPSQSTIQTEDYYGQALLKKKLPHAVQSENELLGFCSKLCRDEQYQHEKATRTGSYIEKKIDPDTEDLQSAVGLESSVIPMNDTCNGINAYCDTLTTILASNDIPLGISEKTDFLGTNATSGVTHALNMQLATNKENNMESSNLSEQNEFANTRESLSTNVNIASSDTGKVKLLLTYSFCTQNFKKASIESFLEIVEDRCFKPYKTLPDFSLMNLMKEICQSAANLVAESCDPQEAVEKQSPLQEPLKNSRRMTRSSFNKSLNSVSKETPSTCTNGPESSLRIDGDSNGILENCDPESSVVIASSPRHNENDITKGEERTRISLINEFTSEKTPPYFHYIPWNVVYQNADVSITLAGIHENDCCINCSGNCLSASIPCACTHETGGAFGYSPNGLLKQEFLNESISMACYSDKHHHFFCKNCPIEKVKDEDKPDVCKGHLVKKFIQECWIKCGCSKHCGNRVVQRGITRNLQVFHTSDGKGWGLRTLEELPRGAFVCEYVGEILTSREIHDRTEQSRDRAKHNYQLFLDADWSSKKLIKDEKALCLDATFFGNVGRFINHRCFDTSLIDVPVTWETPDHHIYHVAFFTTRKVEALEELTWDYGIDFKDRANPVKAFKCLCGSRFCRDSC